MTNKQRPPKSSKSLPASKPSTVSPALLESVEDPLIVELITETTRRCRKALLLVSAIALAVTWGGLVPDEINFQGIHVGTVERANLLYLLGATILYFLANFASYSFSDRRLRKARMARLKLPAMPLLGDLTGLMDQWPRSEGRVDPDFLKSEEFQSRAHLLDHMKLINNVIKASKVRALVEVALPFAVGVTGVIACVQQAGVLPSTRVLVAIFSLTILFSLGLFFQSRWLRSRWPLWRMRWGMRAATFFLNLSRRTSRVKILVRIFTAASNASLLVAFPERRKRPQNEQGPAEEPGSR